jgi:phosphatidylglycerophosphatase A
MTSTNIVPAKILDRIAWAIATGLGSGLAPVASGTFGSAAALVAWWLLGFHEYFATSVATRILLIIALTAIGLWAGQKVIDTQNDSDPKVVVVDEWAGMWISALLLTPQSSIILWGASFFFFRLFDVMKPGPVGALEKLPGSFGVMADDLLAGIFALGCTTAVAMIFFS